MATTEVEGAKAALVRYSAKDVNQVYADFLEITGDCEKFNPLVIDGLKLFSAYQVYSYINFGEDKEAKECTSICQAPDDVRLVFKANLEQIRQVLDDPEFVPCSSEEPCLLETAMEDLGNILKMEREKGVEIEGKEFSDFVFFFCVTYFLKEQRIAG